MVVEEVERRMVPACVALRHMGIASSTYYRWRKAYRRAGLEGLRDHSPGPRRVWNRVTDEERDAVIEQALRHPDEPSRQIAFRVTDTCGFSVSESTVYRLLKAQTPPTPLLGQVFPPSQNTHAAFR